MRFLGDAYLVVPFISDARNLLDFWPSIPECRRAIVLEDLSCLIGMMHSRGIVHGDLNWRNFLVRVDHEWRAEFFLVDLDGAKLLKQPSRRLLADDLKHFRRDMERLEVTQDLQDFFYTRWESNAKGRSSGFRISQVMRIG